MRRLDDLGGGIYIDELGELHVDLEELCIAFGVMPTPENQAVAERIVREELNSHWPNVAVAVKADAGIWKRSN